MTKRRNIYILIKYTKSLFRLFENMYNKSHYQGRPTSLIASSTLPVKSRQVWINHSIN